MQCRSEIDRLMEYKVLRRSCHRGQTGAALVDGYTHPEEIRSRDVDPRYCTQTKNAVLAASARRNRVSAAEGLCSTAERSVCGDVSWLSKRLTPDSETYPARLHNAAELSLASSLESLNEMQSRRRWHHLRDLARLQRERRLLEFFLHVAFAEETPEHGISGRCASENQSPRRI